MIDHDRRMPAKDLTAAGPARPLLGPCLLIVSAVVTLAVLIYFGAWAASDRVSAREEAGQSTSRNSAWEEGLLFVCPFH